ncbi:HU family DNA-binding protein [Proteiniclasticum sp. BAD-10]|uniref:HU family DNA-binding protein n=1 Tax=Proteiniclasticum sediminis TaxID=2804028 RepID=A0A941HQV9_9CLOT|nr:HU family DNA-binding protein [Proteiniclasticum sediminis]
MNKAELITALAEATTFTKKDSEVFLKAFLDTVVGSLEKGDKVQLVGFGTFEVRDRKERVGRNPRTKEEIKIPASKVPVFKPGKDFKTKVNVVPKKKTTKKKAK